MNIDCLLVLEDDSVLNLALDQVLNPDSGIVSVKSKATDYETLGDEIRELDTQVVIIEKSEKWAEEETLANLLVSHPALKIIVVQMDSNFIHIFRKHEIALEKTGDLLKAIQNA